MWCRVYRVEASEAVGRIGAELLCPYPPGIPLVVPGEVLTQEVIAVLMDVIKAGCTVTGASDAALETFIVME